MTKTEEVFLKILKDALHPIGKADTVEEGMSDGVNRAADISCTAQEWAAVLNMAKKQSLFPFVYDATMAYPSFKTYDAANPQYFAAATTAMTAQMERSRAFLNLYRAFQSEGLSPIAMKGIICRSLYGERADLRPSGDEDILIEKKDYEKAASVLEACGFHVEDKQPDRRMDTIQEMTFYGDQLTVELHLNPFGTNSNMREKMNEWFRDVFHSEETVEINGVLVRTMEPTDHFLFLVFHAFKHFTVSGFGLRMMLDILLFAEKYAERIGWSYVSRGLADVGAGSFLADLVEIGNRYLGFALPDEKPAKGAKTVCPDELLRDMFRMGTFGCSTTADVTAGKFIDGAIQKKNAQGKVSDNRFMSYLRMLFPSWQTWTAWKPYLKDRPWMVIPEWFARIVRYLSGNGVTADVRNLDKSYAIAKERMELLKKYGAL